MFSNLQAWLRQDSIRRTFAYYSVFLCLGLSAGVIGPVLPSLASQTATPLASVGLIFMFGSGAYTVGVVGGGRIFDRARGHSLLGAAQIFESAIFFAIPFIRWFWLLLVLFCLRGLAEGLILTGSNTMLIWTHGEKVSPFMNGLHFFFGLGAFISPLLVVLVSNAALGYEWTFRALAAFMLLVGLHMLTRPGSPRPVVQAAHPQAGQAGSRSIYPFVFSAALFLFFYVGAETSFSGWFYTYAVLLKVASAASAAYLTSAFWLAFTVSRLISIPLAVRFAPRQVLPIASACCLIILALVMVLPGSMGLLWLLALGLGFCMAPIWPSGFTLAGQSINMTGRVSGIVLVGDSLGGMLLPWLAGRVLGSLGAQVLIYLVFGAMLLNGLAFLGMLNFRPSRLAGRSLD